MPSSQPDSRRDFFRLAGAGVTGAALGAVVGATPAQAQSARGETSGQFGIFSVRAFGAVGDGHAIDTPAINKAIDAAAAAGGGTVLFPAGTYACYSIRLKSNIELRLERGATILAAEGAQYDAAEPNTPYFMYQDYGHNHWHNSLIWGEDLHDISITGPGLIYGKGLSKGYGPGPRAEGSGVGNKSISLKNCRNVLLRDFAILQGGWFGILATGVDNFTIDNLLIDTNRDGMDIDCCRNVRIANTSVNSPWDDAIVLKSSYALGAPRPTENVTISSCYVSGAWQLGSLIDGTWKKHESGDAHVYRTGRIKFGTESNGGFLNIAISNCVFEGCQGLALETVDGAHLEDVSITNITMRDIISAPIFLRLGARLRGPKETTQPGTLRRVNIGNIVCWNTASHFASILSGIPGHRIEDVSLHDIMIVAEGGGTAEQASIQVPEGIAGYPGPGRLGPTPSWGFFVRHLNGLSMSNIQLKTENPDARPAVILDRVSGAELFRLQAPATAAPMLSLRNVSDFEIRYSHPVKDVRVPNADNLTLPNRAD